MISFKECKNCCLNQVKKLSLLLNTSPEPVLKIVNDAFKLGKIKTAPEYAELIFNSYTELTGIKDPYEQIKLQSNLEAVRLKPILENLVSSKGYSGLSYYTELAIAGNMIDYGAFTNINIEEFLTNAINAEYFRFDIKKFAEDINNSKNILYIGDNAGEIVFDTEFVKYLNSLGKKIIFSVRAKPIINDITYIDAEFVCISEYCNKIIDSGTRIPGTILDRNSIEFQDAFNKADLVISKGQGNFETLYLDSVKHTKIYYLFVIKCEPVAKILKGKVGQKVLFNNR